MARQQAFRYVPLAVTVPIGTTTAAPLVTPVSLGDVMLDEVHVTIPKGPGGLAGVRLDYSGATILPFDTSGRFIISDGAEFDFTIGYAVGRTLSVVTFNIGQYPHTFYLRFKIEDLPDPPKSSVTLVPITAGG